MGPGGKMESYDVPLNPTQAALARDALVKSTRRTERTRSFDEPPVRRPALRPLRQMGEHRVERGQLGW